MNKKLCATILATTMVLGTSMSAMAATNDLADAAVTSGTTTAGDLATNGDIDLDTDISVTKGRVNIDMPKTMSIILNPYNVENLGQVVSPVAKIKNYGNVDLDIRIADFIATPGTGTDINIMPDATVDPDGENITTQKNVFLALTTQVERGVAGKSLTDGDIKIMSEGEEGPFFPAGTEAVWPQVASEGSIAIVGTGDEAVLATEQDFALLTKSIATGSDVGTDADLTTSGVLYFRYDGAVSNSKEWSDTDTLTATPTFRITPSRIEPTE